jgi:imidazolonepropionase-like amidohydrolase
MKLIIKADRLIDSNSLHPLINSALVIENGKIVEIISQDKLKDISTESFDIIDAGNSTIMPGFIEMHSHMHVNAESDAYKQVTTESNEFLLMRAVKAVRSTLSSGVTTMRDLGSKNEIAFPIKEAVNNAVIPGPRLLVTGTPITSTGGHCNSFAYEADTKDEVIKAVRRQFKKGADYIKIMSTGGGFTPGTNMRKAQYSADILKAAVEDAERLGLRVAAHCHGTAGVINCVEAGIHNLIHCSWLSENPSEMFDYHPEITDQIVAKGLFLDPTLGVDRLNQIRDPQRYKLRSELKDPVKRFEILKDMWARGVKFVTGMDSGMTNARFDDFAVMPQVMVEDLGISNMEAIICSTKTSADCLDILQETGTLEPGKSADVIVVKGNPLEDIKLLSNVEDIILKGKIIKRDGKLLI